MLKPLHLAVLGDPIEHSRSPAIHTAAMRHLGIEGTYEARRAGPAELATAVTELRNGGLDGINITMPLKREAAAMAETLTGEASVSLSVNTLRHRAGAVEGHSTDVIASRTAFADERFDRAAPVLILGSGGAAAAALAGASGRTVYVAARDQGRAAALLARVGSEAGLLRFDAGVAGALVVNATPVGMGGEGLPDRVIGPASGIIDLAYGVEETRTVSEARRSGLPFMDGVEFLVLQAAASFEWWTGLPAPVETMLQAARKT